MQDAGTHFSIISDSLVSLKSLLFSEMMAMEAGEDAGAAAGTEEVAAPVVIPFISLAAVKMDSPIAVVDHEQGISLPVKDFPGLVHRVKHYLKVRFGILLFLIMISLRLIP